MFEKGFKASKCKSLLKLVISRIALVRNKRGAQIRQLRKDVAQLLRSGQELSARKRVDMVMKEQNILDAYAVLEKFCELVLTRLTVIKAEKSCPLDTKEAISSLIFAGSRCADLPELLELRSIFEEHYGKQFIVAAAELRSGSCVNKVIIEKISGHRVNDDFRVQLMEDIAAENRVQWSPKDPDIVSYSDVGLKSDQIQNQKYSTGLVDKTSNVIEDEPNVECPIPTSSEREAVSPVPHAADIEQMQFIPFVSSLSKKSSPPGKSVQEQRQFIPFVPSVPRKSSPSTSSMETKTLGWEKEVRNLNRHKTSQSAQGLRKERDKELLADKFSSHDLSFRQERLPNQDGDFYMRARCEMPKHADGLVCAEKASPTLPRQKCTEQHGESSSKSGDGAETDSWKESDKRMDVSIKDTNQHQQKNIVNKTEIHASQPPMTSIKTGSSGRDVKENVDMSLGSADAFPSSNLQPELESTEKVFENELQQRRSKAKVDFNWTSGEESARRSADYEDNLEQSNNRESIANEALNRHSEYQGFQTSLQNQTEQPIRIVKHFLSVTSSESGDDSALIQRPSTKNARSTDFAESIKNNQETSSEDEPNLDPCAFRKPRLNSHAQESVVVHKGNRSGNAMHKCHENEVLQHSSHVQRVYKSEENHLNNQKTELYDSDSEDLVFYLLKKGVAHYPGRSNLKEHSERAGKGAYVSGKSTIAYCGSDEDSLHGSSSTNMFAQKTPVYFDGDDGCHFDEYNMRNLGEQNQGMKREQLNVAEKQKLDYENYLQTRVGKQNTRRKYIGVNCSPYAFDSSTEKDEWLRPRTKNTDESGFQAVIGGVSANCREVMHGKLKWHSSSQEQQDTSSKSGRIGPLNAFDLHCNAGDVHSQDSHPTVQQLPLRKMETAKAEKQEAINLSLVRSKRTTGISVRSRIPRKTDESLKLKPGEQGGSIASNQCIETNYSSYPDTHIVQNICSELPADVNPTVSSKPTSASCLPMSRPSNETRDTTSSEANDVQKASRDQNSTTPHGEIISAQHNSSRQPTTSYLPTSCPRNEANSTAHSGANQVQKGSRDSSPLTRTQVEKSQGQYFSSRQTSASFLPTSQPGFKARESTSAEVSDARKSVSDSSFSTKKQADSSSTHNPSSELTSASNFPSSRPQITKIQTEACLSDDDLMARFQALKAQLY